MENHGLTLSLIEGIAAASGEAIVWLDCDFSHPPERIPQMVYMLNQGFDVAVNSRYVLGGGEQRVGKGGALQLFLSSFLNWMLRFLINPSFADYTSGFIAIRREVLEALPLRGDYGEYFIDLVYRALRKKYRLCELPYQAMPRRSGQSKTGSTLLQFWRRGRKYLAVIARLRLDTLLGRL